ncbi:hypothetical protein MF406_18280 (plasmid) [Georgenia sp. TF02-10]|uniref:hypothetical protein n=1 Tax=Georgenia sp. TF02-10 TaxID=2917725 RepID=UPI001FA70E7B|nr:hypothetical protein [Georgenia sp. TF02-10]UNX56594.1 hypothetical protein MF406_18280 [Georgenia sp. TF02-10]
MGHEFYIEYDGSGAAASRFASKARELAAAATDGAEGSRVFPDDPSSHLDDLLLGPLRAGMDVVNAADDILTAVGGRLSAFSLELEALSRLVKDTVQVTNEIDVEYRL